MGASSRFFSSSSFRLLALERRRVTLVEVGKLVDAKNTWRVSACVCCVCGVCEVENAFVLSSSFALKFIEKTIAPTTGSAQLSREMLRIWMLTWNVRCIFTGSGRVSLRLWEHFYKLSQRTVSGQIAPASAAVSVVFLHFFFGQVVAYNPDVFFFTVVVVVVVVVSAR